MWVFSFRKCVKTRSSWHLLTFWPLLCWSVLKTRTCTHCFYVFYFSPTFANRQKWKEKCITHHYSFLSLLWDILCCKSKFQYLFSLFIQRNLFFLCFCSCCSVLVDLYYVQFDSILTLLLWMWISKLSRIQGTCLGRDLSWGEILWMTNCIYKNFFHD